MSQLTYETRPREYVSKYVSYKFDRAKCKNYPASQKCPHFASRTLVLLKCEQRQRNTHTQTPTHTDIKKQYL